MRFEAGLRNEARPHGSGTSQREMRELFEDISTELIENVFGRNRTSLLERAGPGGGQFIVGIVQPIEFPSSPALGELRRDFL